MHVFRRSLPALFAVLPLAVAAPAGAATLTLGSDLKAPATHVESQGADTAFWLAAPPAAITVPENGEVVSVTIKGSALKEQGAADPATLIHIQTLDAPDANGARKVNLSSQDFNMPFDDPTAVTTFTPENLCVNKGGTVAFNTIGGFKWGGSLTAPLDEAHYHRGTPWQIFAAKSTSATAWFSKDNGTKNGMTLTPSGGTNAVDGYGRSLPGTELLMQVVVKTGADRGIACLRAQDGDQAVTDLHNSGKVHELRVAGGTAQRPYVTKDRLFNVGIYCETPDPGPCTGTATMQIGSRVLAKVSGLSVTPNSSGKVAMRLSKADFKKLAKKKSLAVTFVLVSQYGTVTTPMTIRR
jgi:hypothetical protein